MGSVDDLFTTFVRCVARRATATVMCFAFTTGENPRQSIATRASVFAYELFNLTYNAIEFVDEIGMIAVLPKRGH